MKLVSWLTCAAGLAVGAMTSSTLASVPVIDKADFYDPTPGSWSGNGVPGGSTWTNNWVFQSDNGGTGAAGSFLAGAGNGDLNNIKSPNRAWGSYANNGGQGDSTARFVASRRFQSDDFNTANMLTGQTFTMYMENGGIQSTGLGAPRDGVAGISLGSGSTTDPALLNPFVGGNVGALNSHAQFLLAFRGGSANYLFWDSSGATVDTGIGWRDSGVRLDFTLNNAFLGTYTATITPVTGGTPFSYNGVINGGIDRVSLHNWDAEWDNVYWNTVSVVPTPASIGLLGFGGLFAARRRR